MKIRKSVLYGPRWKKARALYLAENPVCLRCAEDNITTPAQEVDHIQPHENDPQLFWDEENWAPLCRRCHQKKHGGRGYSTEVDLDGKPIDSNHPFNRGGSNLSRT